MTDEQRQRIHDIVYSCDDRAELAEQIVALEDENVKLRGLVLCLLTCSSDSDDACDKCPVNGGSGIWDFADFCDSLLDRVRELEIEV